MTDAFYQKWIFYKCRRGHFIKTHVCVNIIKNIIMWSYMYINVSLLYLRWTCSLHCVNSRNSQFGNKIIVDIFTMSLLPLFLIVTSYLLILLLISGSLTTELLTNYYNITVSHTKMIAHFSSRNDLCSIFEKNIHLDFCPFGGAVDANSECYIYWYAPRRLMGHLSLHSSLWWRKMFSFIVQPFFQSRVRCQRKIV